MLRVTLSGCVINQALYVELWATFTDDDGDDVNEHDGDCDDADPSIFPGADERCNDEDDCDGERDEAPVDATWYADADGYGDDAMATATCSPTEGQVSVPGGCDDADARFHPEGPSGATLQMTTVTGMWTWAQRMRRSGPSTSTATDTAGAPSSSLAPRLPPPPASGRLRR